MLCQGSPFKTLKISLHQGKHSPGKLLFFFPPPEVYLGGGTSYQTFSQPTIFVCAPTGASQCINLQLK